MGTPGDKSGAVLPPLLAHYPPYEAPHAGHGRQLSLAQARENLAYFESVKDHRLACIAALLRSAANIDPEPALHSPREHGAALTDALDRWAAAQWPTLPAPQLPRLSAWLESSRRGPDIVYSMLLDLAILLGEVVRTGNADWSWGLDLDTSRLQAGLETARRTVLSADPVGAATQPFLIDVESIVVGRYLMPAQSSWMRGADGGGPRSLNPWHRLVDEGLAGQAMAAWRR